MRFSKELIIFDLDGTLIDSVPDLALSIDAMLSSLGAEVVGEAKVREWVGNGAEKLVQRALAHGGIDKSRLPEALALFLNHYEENCAVNTALYPGVSSALSWFADHNVMMAIATNKPSRFIKPIIESLGIDRYFKVIIGGDQVAEKKPAPAQLLWCMQQCKSTPTQTLMIGDSRNDIEAAHNAGVDVVAVNYGYNHGRPITEERVDRVIANLCELIET